MDNKKRITKHDTEDNWNKAINFKPLKDEVIVYDEGDTHEDPYNKNSDIIATYDYKRFKMGDGINFVKDLPFVYTTISNEEICKLFN